MEMCLFPLCSNVEMAVSERYGFHLPHLYREVPLSAVALCVIGDMLILYLRLICLKTCIHKVKKFFTFMLPCIVIDIFFK